MPTTQVRKKRIQNCAQTLRVFDRVWEIRLCWGDSLSPIIEHCLEFPEKSDQISCVLKKSYSYNDATVGKKKSDKLLFVVNHILKLKTNFSLLFL